MYCAIRNFEDYNFNGDKSNIKEFIYPYFATELMEKLEMSKDKDKTFVFKYRGTPTKEDLRDMAALGEVRDNVKIMFSEVSNLFDAPKSIKYFFEWGSMNADNLDKMNALIELGVSDVYVSGQLGFEMSNARTLADRKGVSIRVVPNIAQISGLGYREELDNLTSFWIRPNDLYLYEGFVDVVEFVCEDTKQSIFHEAYFVDKYWHGNLAPLIAGLGELNNKGLIPHFTIARLNCGKKCILDKCHSCHRLAISAKIIADNNLEIELENEEESI